MLGTTARLGTSPMQCFKKSCRFCHCSLLRNNWTTYHFSYPHYSKQPLFPDYRFPHVSKIVTYIKSTEASLIEHAIYYGALICLDKIWIIFLVFQFSLVIQYHYRILRRITGLFPSGFRIFMNPSCWFHFQWVCFWALPQMILQFDIPSNTLQAN